MYSYNSTQPHEHLGSKSGGQTNKNNKEQEAEKEGEGKEKSWIQLFRIQPRMGLQSLVWHRVCGSGRGEYKIGENAVKQRNQGSKLLRVHTARRPSAVADHTFSSVPSSSGVKGSALHDDRTHSLVWDCLTEALVVLFCILLGSSLPTSTVYPASRGHARVSHDKQGFHAVLKVKEVSRLLNLQFPLSSVLSPSLSH